MAVTLFRTASLVLSNYVLNYYRLFLANQRILKFKLVFGWRTLVVTVFLMILMLIENIYVHACRMGVSMPCTQPHQYTLMQSMQQINIGH